MGGCWGVGSSGEVGVLTGHPIVPREAEVVTFHMRGNSWQKIFVVCARASVKLMRSSILILQSGLFLFALLFLYPSLFNKYSAY